MLLDGPGQDMMRKAVADAADVSTEHRGLLAFVGDGRCSSCRRDEGNTSAEGFRILSWHAAGQSEDCAGKLHVPSCCGLWCRGQLTSIESTQQELAKLETGILDDLEALREESDSTRDILQDIAATLLALYKAVNSLRSAAPKGSLDSPDSPPNSTDQPQQASTKPSQL